MVACSQAPAEQRAQPVGAGTPQTAPVEDDPGEGEEPGDAGGGDNCGGTGICFDWPLPGVDARDWVINNYVDLGPGPALADWSGAVGADAKVYDEHTGIDIDVPTFRAMDANVPVLAAADGVVISASDTEEDRHVSCIGGPNLVKIQHANGWTTAYLHLKRDSLVVKTGDAVKAGAKLAVVGSSGCSTAPHVHFEVRDASGAVVEPFLVGAWRAPPVYATPLGIMDVTLRAAFISGADDIKDPPLNVTEMKLGSEFSVGLSVAGGKAGDTITVRYLRPDGSISFEPTLTFSQVYRHSYWLWNQRLDEEEGTWAIEILANGVLARRLFVTQVP